MSEMLFNANVHRQLENGDPDRAESGEIKLKTNWQKTALDRQGRTFNSKIHGDKIALDDEGYLTVRRREAKAPPGQIGRSEAFVAQFHEKGYAYYLMNDDPGAFEQAEQHDWEVVRDEKGAPAEMDVGQARRPATKGRLFRKPQEWYDEDQRKKYERNTQRFKQTTSPNEEMGQYEATPSPLR